MMSKIVTSAVYYSGATRDTRNIEIEVMGETVYIRVGKSLASLPYEKLIKLIQMAAADSKHEVVKVVGETLVPKSDVLGRTVTGLPASQGTQSMLDMPETNEIH
jgi:hypothetical protein